MSQPGLFDSDDLAAQLEQTVGDQPHQLRARARYLAGILSIWVYDGKPSEAQRQRLLDEANELLERLSGGPAASTPGRAAEHRGVRAGATIEDNEDAPHCVVVRYYLDPPPPGLDREVYMHNAVRVPGES